MGRDQLSLLCGTLIGIHKLEGLKLLQSDHLISLFDISLKALETVSRFLGNFSKSHHTLSPVLMKLRVK
jgi:hypothetical protein